MKKIMVWLAAIVLVMGCLGTAYALLVEGAKPVVPDLDTLRQIYEARQKGMDMWVEDHYLPPPELTTWEELARWREDMLRKTSDGSYIPDGVFIFRPGVTTEPAEVQEAKTEITSPTAAPSLNLPQDGAAVANVEKKKEWTEEDLLRTEGEIRRKILEWEDRWRRRDELIATGEIPIGPTFSGTSDGKISVSSISSGEIKIVPQMGGSKKDTILPVAK